MATILLQTAGAALGGLFGPVGAIVGRAVGALAGAAVDQAVIGGSRTIAGQRLGIGRIPTSEEGAGIARLYGTARIAGNLIWATRFEETVTEERQGSKGGPRVETFRYFANFAVGLCEGPVAGIRRIWADGRLVDRTDYEIRLHRGTDDQLPDPLIEAKQGAGNAPAYRGLAYVVFERLPLDGFGNRIPVLQFEVIRPIGTLERDLKAVTIIPGATEHGYATAVVTESTGPGESRAINRNIEFAASDWTASLDELQALCPKLEAVALVAAWFGTDLRAGECAFHPGVEVSERVDESAPWSVAGIDRASAYLVSRKDGAPSFGGTPSDASVLAAIADLRNRGLKIFLYPFVLMDVPAGNDLPDPHGGASQPAYPWRGRITCHPASADGTATARDQIDAFCSGAAGYRRLVLHYAGLAQAAGGVDGFVIGSEMRGLTHLRDETGAFPFVEQLVELAGDVRAMVGPATQITYAADWSEYFGYQPADGSGDVFYNLDPLWMADAIDAVGIDNYMPLADWRDDDLAVGNPDGFSTPTDAAAMRAQITAGEGFDWFYASDADRKARLRTAISDGAAGKPWVFRYKDIESWWSNPHHERIGGIERPEATAWTPRAKPVWFTELGCPAVDKAANQPNVFPDAKSSENALPHFSSGARSDLTQRRFLDAHLGHWQSAAAPAGMVAENRIFAWAWDARPYPAFPAQTALWSDGGNWQSGHWLNGRLGNAPAADLIAAILRDHGFEDVEIEDIPGDIVGYVQAGPASARQVLEPLMDLLQVDASESAGTIRFRSRTRTVGVAVPVDAVADLDGEALFEATRAQESERASEAVLDHADPLTAYEPATARSRRLAAGNNRQHRLALPVVIGEAAALGEVEMWLRDHWSGLNRLSFVLPPNAIALEPGDIVRLGEGPDRPYLVGRIDDGAVRRVEARAVALGMPAAGAGPSRPPVDSGPMPGAWAPIIHLLDLPMLAGTDASQWMRAAAFSRPWRPLTLLSSPGADGFERRASVAKPARIGRLLAPLAPGASSGLFDRFGAVHCRLYFGAPASRDDLAVLNGANMCAIRSAAGGFEVVQFADAEETAPGEWRLTRLLRGQAGTEDAMAAGAAEGADIILIDDSVVPAGLRPEEAGLQLNWRAESAAGNAAVASAHSGGLRALTPLAPVHLEGWRTPDGDIALSWLRRGRIDADGWLAPDIPLGEPREAYRVEILDGGTVLRSVEVEVPALLYGQADELADFGTPQTSLLVRVRQVGGHVPLGLPATATLAV